MMYSLLQLGQLKSCRQSRVLIESSHFSLDMHVLKGPDCPANEPAVGERVSDRERLQLREQPLLELLQAGKIQSLEPRFELLPQALDGMELGRAAGWNTARTLLGHCRSEAR